MGKEENMLIDVVYQILSRRPLAFLIHRRIDVTMRMFLEVPHIIKKKNILTF